MVSRAPNTTGNAFPEPYGRISRATDILDGEIEIVDPDTPPPRLCFGVEVEQADAEDEMQRWRQAREELKSRCARRNWFHRLVDAVRSYQQSREESRFLAASRQLEERVKELECLNNVISMMGNEYASISVLLNDLVRVLPPGFQHPDVAAARITLAGRSAETAGFSHTAWSLKSQIVIGNEVAGSVEVVYLEARPEADIGPFLREERLLLQRVAQTIGQAAERYKFRDLQKLHSGQIDRANAALQRFAMTTSHHLQEPLRAICSYSQLLVQRHVPEGDDSAREYAQYITEAVDRMGQLIESMAVYANVPRESQSRYEADIGSVIAGVVKEFELTTKRLNARIRVSPMPLLAIRPSHAEELFKNLIGNALKFHSDEPPDIRIWSEPSEEICSLYVSDNGVGIPSEHIERIFELYARLMPRERYPGNGVGLAVCRRIMESYGGEIWAMSSDAGSVFTVTFSSAHVIQAESCEEPTDEDSASFDFKEHSNAG